MPSTQPASHQNRRKGKNGHQIDDDDRVDYANDPLENSMNATAELEDDSPFRDAGADDVSLERPEAETSVSLPRTEAPIEEFLAPPKRKGPCVLNTVHRLPKSRRMLTRHL